MTTRQGARRRERQAQAPRSHRVYLAYNDFELTVVQEAAKRDDMAVAAWAARSALAVAKEQVVPVSVDARDVLVELIRARSELVRAIGALQGQPPHEACSVRLVEEAVKRVDDATLQVMRERVPRT